MSCMHGKIAMYQGHNSRFIKDRNAELRQVNMAKCFLIVSTLILGSITQITVISDSSSDLRASL